MITFKSIAHFRERLAELLKVRRGVYSGVTTEIANEFRGKTIEQIRVNYDMILMESDAIVIKLRLPDKRTRLAKKDGYRLIYLVSKLTEFLAFIDIYPKRGPRQQLDIEDKELKRLLLCFAEEKENGLLEDYIIE